MTFELLSFSFSALGALVSLGFPLTRETVLFLFPKRFIPLFLAALERSLGFLARVNPWLGHYISERVIEYSFVVESLAAIPAERVLDVGCCESFFTHFLIENGFDTYGIDVRPYPEKSPRLNFYQANTWDTPFEDGYFGVIVVVSTLEHIGLGAYGGPVEDGGDLMTMRELRRILDNNGTLLLTLPVSSEYSVDCERRYDYDRLLGLLEGFTLERGEIWLHESRRWVETRIDGFESMRDAMGEGLACLELSKRRRRVGRGEH